MRVAITGAAGLIGTKLAAGLCGRHELRLLDVVQPRADVPGTESLVADVRRPADLQRAFIGADAIIHLAIAGGHEGDYEDDEFNQQRFDVNVRGTFNVLQAARRAGVRRVVFTSSLMVVWGYAPPQWVESDAAPRPVGSYALTKHLGEVMCAHAAREHQLSIVALRIPKPIDLGDPAWRERTLRPQWIAFPELIEAYRCALEAANIDFQIVTVVGDSSQRRWDLTKAERVLGYRPKIRLEDLGYRLGDERAPLTVG